jgi:hypothetical protein
MTTRAICKTLLPAAIVLAGAVLAAPREAYSATDLETFERSFARSAAVDQVSRPKATCVCLSDDAFRGAGGLLTHGSRFIKGGVSAFDVDVRVAEVSCVVLGFDPDDGGRVRSRSCAPFAIPPR